MASSTSLHNISNTIQFRRGRLRYIRLRFRTMKTCLFNRKDFDICRLSHNSRNKSVSQYRVRNSAQSQLCANDDNFCGMPSIFRDRKVVGTRKVRSLKSSIFFSKKKKKRKLPTQCNLLLRNHSEAHDP